MSAKVQSFPEITKLMFTICTAATSIFASVRLQNINILWYGDGMGPCRYMPIRFITLYAE